jgi:hypothetical protein
MTKTNTNSDSTDSTVQKVAKEVEHLDNPDLGAHPSELGVLDAVSAAVGTVLGGAVSGVTVGMVAGPVGAAAGAVVGAVAGGYAGLEATKLIDPTIEDDWLRKEFRKRPYIREGSNYEDYVPLYQMGAMAEAKNTARSFEEVEADVRKEYELSGRNEMMPWGDARPAIFDAYNRSAILRKTRTSNRDKSADGPQISQN